MGPSSKQLQYTGAVPAVQRITTASRYRGLARTTNHRGFSRDLIPQTTPTLCLRFFESGPHRVGGHQVNRVLVRCSASVATFLDSPTTHSKKTTIHRRCQGGTGHREGILRRVSPAKVVLGGDQRSDQALRCASIPNDPPDPTDDSRPGMCRC